MRDGPGYEGRFAVLEIAYDDGTAAMLWEDNVAPKGLSTGIRRSRSWSASTQ